MSVSVGRNEPCPCGSGKKYKKCCMQKKTVIQLQDFKIERFYQMKNNLVLQLEDFIYKKLSPSEYYSIKSAFKNRAKLHSGQELQVFLDFWLYFFYRYENGLRGIEWFLQERGQRLTEDERAMVQRWAGLKPKLVQAIDKTDDEVIFIDSFTKEKLRVSAHKENIPLLTPWYSTLALLEPVENVHYFNGVRRMTSPVGFQRAAELVESLMKETGLGHEDVLVEYYPELLAALAHGKDKEAEGEREYIQYEYKFSVKDKRSGENFLYNEEYLNITDWEDSYKKLVWLEDISLYQDSELDGQIKFGEVAAFLELRDDTLTFVSNRLETVNVFLKNIEKVPGAFELQENREEKVTLPVNVDITQLSLKMDKEIPPYFATYAQNLWSFEKNRPIARFDNLSLRELVEKGQADKADLWLKQAEYRLYLLHQQHYGKVEITADFNTIRRKLGLALSPFVTGGAQRRSEIVPLTKQAPRPNVMLQEEIPVYENLGFSPETIDNFYTKDIIAFYKEKTTGVSDSTRRKYETSLYDIRQFLEAHPAENWNACDKAFWQDFLEKGIYEINETVSKTKLKDRTSTVKAFAKWLEKNKNYEHAKQIAELKVPVPN